jgi:hypothetical protein
MMVNHPNRPTRRRTVITARLEFAAILVAARAKADALETIWRDEIRRMGYLDEWAWYRAGCPGAVAVRADKNFLDALHRFYGLRDGGAK